MNNSYQWARGSDEKEFRDKNLKNLFRRFFVLFLFLLWWNAKKMVIMRQFERFDPLRGFLGCDTDALWFKTSWYGVVNKKVLHKSQEEMHKKMKITKQRAKNLVHVQ